MSFLDVKEEELPFWADQSIANINKILAKDDFPCVFAKKASQQKTISWLFCDSTASSKDMFCKGW